MDALKPILNILQEGRPLTNAEATRAFEIILNGEAEVSQIGAFIGMLRVRGETVDEIAAGVNVMRANALKVKVPTHVLDTCGTGGDGSFGGGSLRRVCCKTWHARSNIKIRLFRCVGSTRCKIIIVT
jgi:anthranilate phosphoribosyltransferase